MPKRAWCVKYIILATRIEEITSYANYSMLMSAIIYFTKEDAMCKDEARQAGDVPEIEVTEDMIEAGVMVLEHSGRLLEPRLSSDDLLAAELYRAMMRVRLYGCGQRCHQTEG